MDYSTSYEVSGGTPWVMIIIWLAIAVFLIISMWKVFAKAGKPGWGAIIPIYNIILLLQISGKPVWWIILLCIPLVNIVIYLLVCLALAEKFGKSSGFGVGLFLLSIVFFPMLGFGSAQYQG